MKINRNVLAAASGFKRNANGGVFIPGKNYSKEKWLEIAGVFHKHVEDFNDMPSIRCLAKKTGISRESAKKAIAFIGNGEIDFKKRGHGRSGVGSLMSLSPEEERFLLILRTEEPGRSNQSYVIELQAFSGRKVSEGFISGF